MSLISCSQFLAWNVAGIFLVLVLRRHRVRLATCYVW
jgi:hypothetical protein